MVPRTEDMWILAALVVTALAAMPTTVEEFHAQPVEEHVKDLSGQAFVDYINEHQSFYRAEYSPEAEAFVKARIMDSKYLVEPKKEEVLEDVYGNDPPESFDARTHWPECRSIGTIRDQSSCGSCWAVSSAEAMSDEICVQSNSTIRVMISDSDILSCCGVSCGYGCQGGWPIEAYKWMQRDGVVTGGKYRQKVMLHKTMATLRRLNYFEKLNSLKKVCKPYAFYPCGHHQNDPYYGPCPGRLWPTPKCRKTCQRKYNKSYQEDKHFGK
ncbi:papain family cysteine protease [Ancylostoma caninum]|uniref:Papain family cysteine protease n=1 Tax=Ancylostoma caninum TaxID=29170 RepID=A0A368GWJ0_ANCCA|nr:papain family cysteine protease [Ancylostoma caninum]